MEFGAGKQEDGLDSNWLIENLGEEGKEEKEKVQSEELKMKVC